MCWRWCGLSYKFPVYQHGARISLRLSLWIRSSRQRVRWWEFPDFHRFVKKNYNHYKWLILPITFSFSSLSIYQVSVIFHWNLNLLTCMFDRYWWMRDADSAVRCGPRYLWESLPGTFACTCDVGYTGDGFKCTGKILSHLLLHLPKPKNRSVHLFYLWDGGGDGAECFFLFQTSK